MYLIVATADTTTSVAKALKKIDIPPKRALLTAEERQGRAIAGSKGTKASTYLSNIDNKSAFIAVKLRNFFTEDINSQMTS